MTKFFSTCLLCCLFLACNNKADNSKNTIIDNNDKIKNSLTAELDSIQQNGQLIGFGVAIVNKNGTLYQNGFGYANKETGKEYTANTVQNIASVSKILIGIALMKAQEMGKLKLDDPVNSYLPFKVNNPSYPNEEITIRHLANHTSGINDTDIYMDNAWVLLPDQNLDNIRTDYPDQRLNPAEKNISMDQYLENYLVDDGSLYKNENYINFKPGQRHNYTNIGAGLAALILENATGQKFDSFTKEHILIPLKMTSSGWSVEQVDLTEHSRLYRNDYSILPFYTAITYPDGMLISSSHDIAKLLSELIKGFSGEGTILKKESYVQFFEEQLNEHHFEPESRRYEHPYDGDFSPATFIGHSNQGYIGHSGGDAGVGTWLYFNKETKTGRYIVKNTDGGNDNRAKELQYFAIWDKMDEYIEKLNK